MLKCGALDMAARWSKPVANVKFRPARDAGTSGYIELAGRQRISLVRSARICPWRDVPDDLILARSIGTSRYFSMRASKCPAPNLLP